MRKKCPRCGSYKFYKGILTTPSQPVTFIPRDDAGNLTSQILKIKAYGCGNCGYIETSLDIDKE